MAKLGLWASGLIGTFVCYGVVQERIMTRPYGEHLDTFRDSTFLILLNRIFTFSMAVAIIKASGAPLKPSAPLHKFGLVSLMNFCATWCQYEALLFVNFPLQTLIKTGKMIPVMIINAVTSPEKLKKYSVADYVVAAVTTLGCTCFVLSGDVSTHVKDPMKGATVVGVVLMLCHLFCDGLTSTTQERNFRDYKLSTHEQMLWVNLCSALISVVLCVTSGGLSSSLTFILQHPLFLMHALGLSVCSFVGQLILYHVVKEFGALVFATIMVTRQVFSLILSCIIFLHPLTAVQALCGVVVFGALYYKAAAAHGKTSK
eukprot:TRINITY_DN3613_c0_g1_i2.p1 TRINITY_DN3613_c0_g1~~TRINITY_DN3613_c0_g1_i2.p1  ORF type:complete len:361 (-),score=79.25 TRINITY_DN3613_c0_g1_i2:1055-1999(-)